ncbi:hypothetical protein RSOLAG22IIIB_08055 [Rhizoctonia solani]|uniref:Uncharacterized protein n=1 Tax=Rhizoctonia solani TaxID=456999 RepID=A0A0K6FQY8_9AGAM|nr:hypothetical protein RSOLAG22IIIB_08055 [Rhizoctonia solani]
MHCRLNKAITKTEPVAPVQRDAKGREIISPEERARREEKLRLREERERQKQKARAERMTELSRKLYIHRKRDRESSTRRRPKGRYARSRPTSSKEGIMASSCLMRLGLFMSPRLNITWLRTRRLWVWEDGYIMFSET